MLLPKGANSTLVSEVADQELSFKKMGALLREHSKINTNATTGTINFSAREQNVVLRTTNASATLFSTFEGTQAQALIILWKLKKIYLLLLKSNKEALLTIWQTLQIDGSTVSPVYWQVRTAIRGYC